MDATYGVEDVAAMTGLSTRTVRKYIAQGLLRGEKCRGAWRFTGRDFEAFLEQEQVRRSVRTRGNALLWDFLLTERRRKPEACAVVDLPAGAGEPEIRRALLERVNALGLRCAYWYQEKNAAARAILQGPPGAVGRLLTELAGEKNGAE